MNHTQSETKMNTVTTQSSVERGVVVGVHRDGRPLITTESDSRPRAARVTWMSEPLRWEKCEGLSVAAARLGDEPLVVGLLDAPPAEARERASGPLRIENDEEIVLECGEARIALRADGRIEILGGYVLSRGRSVQKIQGGSVQIN